MGKCKRKRSASKDLLHLENLPQSSTLERRLMICNAKDSFTLKSHGIQSERVPTSTVPHCRVLDRVKSFLPVIDEANHKLNAELQEQGFNRLNIETVSKDENAPYIEMDLILGVADLHTPEAVAAAELAMNGQVPSNISATSSEDENEGDSECDNTCGDDRSLINNEEGML